MSDYDMKVKSVGCIHNMELCIEMISCSSPFKNILGATTQFLCHSVDTRMYSEEQRSKGVYKEFQFGLCPASWESIRGSS